jgi:nucleotide-binding universal stress UspA family protein
VSDPQANSFRRAIVALAGGSCDDRIVRLAAELGRTAHGELIGVHVVEIGWSMPLDADVAARSEAAQRILDQAEVVAETLKARLEPVLLQARDVGAALVDEATERGADLLVMGLPYRKRFGGDFAIGRTIPYVLKHAPCAVWVVREPIPVEPLELATAAAGGKEHR